MIIYEDDINKVKEELVYLMLFKDHKRIDLSLVEFRNRNRKNDSLTKILLDKDKIFEKNQSPSDKDYWTKKPSQKEFNDCCNEFWWVSTYVVKGLLRNELIYAKEIHETIVRKMYMKVIAWNIAADHRFEINLGANNRFIEKYLDSETKIQIESTYSNLVKSDMWDSLLSMADSFQEKSIKLS